MKPGDIIEKAFWADGRETPGMLEQFYKDMLTLVEIDAERAGMVVLPPTFVVKRPGEDRVPPVPKHIQGPDVRLIVAEARVAGERIIVVNSFLGDLDHKDLLRLRALMREIAPLYGYTEELTDEWCDKMIEQIGPKAAERAVRDKVDEKPIGWLHTL